MELFLLRHGETDENVSRIIQGWLDTELNENGKAQSREAAEQFNETIDAIYSSDLRRATETASEFQRKYPVVPYFEDERLRERNFGDATGDHHDTLNWEVFWASSNTVSIPNAETLDEFNIRVQSFIRSLKASGFSKVLVVTHGGTINRFLDLTSANHQNIMHSNASITRVTI